MAEGTRFRKLEETQEAQATQINELIDFSNKTTAQITELTQQSNQAVQRLNEVQTTLTSLVGRLDQLMRAPPPPNNGAQNPPQPLPIHAPPNPPQNFPPVIQPRPFKLDFPRFDGTNPSGWIFKATQFFDFHQTPSPQRLQIASFHMDGQALAWFQWMHTNYPFPDWQVFVQALEARFGDSPYADHMGSLAKLTQTSTVTSYISQYETLANRTTNLPPEFLLRNFISGLKPNIRREVQAIKPHTIIEAQGLAKLQEEKLADLVDETQKVTTPALPSSNNNTSSNTTTIRRLSPEEVRTRRQQGLCFNCNDKFSPGHKCKNPATILFLEAGIGEHDSVSIPTEAWLQTDPG